MRAIHILGGNLLMLKRHLMAVSTVVILMACGMGFAKENSATKESKNKETTKKAEESKEGMGHEDILKVSEAFGHFIGRNLNAPGIHLDLESIIKGMREGAAGQPAPMSDKEYEAL